MFYCDRPLRYVQAVLVASTFILLLPFVVMLWTALQTPLYATTHTHAGGAFALLFQQADAGIALFNSLALALISATAQVLVASMGGYALAQASSTEPWQQRCVKVTLPLLSMALVLPLQTNLVSLFYTVQQLGGLNHAWGVLLPAVLSPFAVLVYWQWFKQQPASYGDAATLEGASFVQRYWHVAFPMTQPVTLTLWVFGFVASWNSLLWPLLVLQQKSLLTLPLWLTTLKESYRDGLDWPVMMAGCVLSVLPLLVLFLMTQQQLMASIGEGGLKE
ncbi:MAG: carbohydrate ABC transporter permease [Vampirovibrionales bacterium]